MLQYLLGWLHRKMAPNTLLLAAHSASQQQRHPVYTEQLLLPNTSPAASMGVALLLPGVMQYTKTREGSVMH